jgi:hypothetical protein
MGAVNALPSEQVLGAPIAIGAATRAGQQRASVGARVTMLPMLAIITAFWIYVALSNVLYAHGMQAGFADVSREPLFAGWIPRVLQHLLLYPVLIGCIWASLRIGWQPVWRAVPLQLLLGLVFSALAAPALMVSESLLGEPELQSQLWPWKHAAMFGGPHSSLWLASATSFLLTYGFGLVLITGLAMYQRFRDSQLRFAALERVLASTRLAALRLQLSPHTLFNLLHTIRGQIAWDPASAQSMVVQLGDVLRRLLAAGERDFSRLTDEFEFVRLYLQLQQNRFSDRLTIRMVDLGALPQLWVPSLILQPLVENAVVHGLAGHAGAVSISVEAEVSDNELALRVVNTIAADAKLGAQGIGLRNVRERLMLQFGDRASFHSGSADGLTWSAQIRMPLVHDAIDPGRGTG